MREVARRMGIRPPSLDVYFPSKSAIYDALFERGAQMLLEHFENDAQTGTDEQTLDEALMRVAERFVR